MSFLGFVYDQSSNELRPEYHERRFLLGLYLDRQTETSRQFAIQPFYSYYRDDSVGEVDEQYFFYFYRYRKARGQEKRTILFFFSF